MSTPSLSAGEPPRRMYTVSLFEGPDPRKAGPGQFRQVNVWAVNAQHALMLVKTDNPHGIAFDPRPAAESRR